MILLFALSALAGCIAGMWFAPFFRLGLRHDQAWYMYVASRVLQGVKLYGPELTDTNPPFVVWFHMLPLSMARWLHIDESSAFCSFFLLSFVASVSWAGSLLRRLWNVDSLWTAAFVLSAVVSFLPPAQGFAMGQREHFMALFLLPYTVIAAARFSGATGSSLSRMESACVGLLAAVGVCLKPQHLLVVICVEACVLVRRRRMSANMEASTIAMVAAGALYFAAVELFARSYLTEMVPLLRDSYWGGDIPYTDILRGNLRLFVSQAICALILFFNFARLRTAPLIVVWIASSVGALLANIQQHKKFLYHPLPALCFLLLAACMLAWEMALLLAAGARDRTEVATARVGTKAIALGLASCGCAALLTALYVPRKADPFWFHSAELEQAFAPYPPGTSVAYLSYDFSHMPLVFNRHLFWAQREPTMFMLESIWKSEGLEPGYISRHLSAQRVAEISAVQRRWVGEDLARFHPRVVAVLRCGFWPCKQPGTQYYFNLLDWLNQSPAFRAAWANYKYDRTYGKEVDVYLRQPDAR